MKKKKRNMKTKKKMKNDDDKKSKNIQVSIGQWGGLAMGKAPAHYQRNTNNHYGNEMY